VKLCKCAFAQRKKSYLGYAISVDWVATCPSKLQTIADWPIPTSVK
jgi:hypothetical protein